MNFDDPPADPVEQFNRWFDEAEHAAALPNPSAMTLATVDPDGRPSARIVLLKRFDHRGAVFFTNYRSAKADALEANPYAALLLHWDHLNRQVRISGPVRKVSEQESDAYFAQRPLGSRIGAWASDQSQPVASRAELDQRYESMAKRFGDADVPRPPHWGGYIVALQMIEFWQGRESRLHDRVLYTAQPGGAWNVHRLCP
jgi:pyridoxamine 5'-phosphate oxidase